MLMDCYWFANNQIKVSIPLYHITFTPKVLWALQQIGWYTKYLELFYQYTIYCPTIVLVRFPIIQFLTTATILSITQLCLDTYCKWVNSTEAILVWEQGLCIIKNYDRWSAENTNNAITIFSTFVTLKSEMKLQCLFA